MAPLIPRTVTDDGLTMIPRLAITLNNNLLQQLILIKLNNYSLFTFAVKIAMALDTAIMPTNVIAHFKT